MAAVAVANRAAKNIGPGGFPLGQKKLYVPNSVVTFLRPKPGQSATTATFEVPLTFNKFDFRDYLYHLYNVETTSVRSFINQRMPAQRAIQGKTNGKWYRPRAQKLMIVDLVKPFTWPARPAEEDMDPWDHKLFKAVEDGHKSEIAVAEARASWGPQKMRTDSAMPRERRELAQQAKQLLRGEKAWAPGTQAMGKVASAKMRKQPDAISKEDRRFLAAVDRADEAEMAAGEEARLLTNVAKQSAKDETKGVLAQTVKDKRRP